MYDLEIDSKEDYIKERASIIEEEFKIPKNSLRVYGMDIFKDFREKVGRDFVVKPPGE